MDRPDGDSLETGLRRTLYRRIHGRIKMAVRDATSAQIMKALEAETVVGTIAELLTAVPAHAGETDDWAKALLRGAAQKAALLEAAGGTYTTGQVAEFLGISVQAVQQRLRRGSLLAVRLNNGEWGFPVVQFSETGVPAGLPHLLRAFAETNPWVQLSILLSEDYGEGRIIDWVREGRRMAEAEAIARSHGYQGAA